MRPALLFACTLLAPALAGAEVVELDGDALVDVAIPGISIVPQVTDKSFDADDQRLREANSDRLNARDPAGPALAVSNAEALKAPPTLDSLVPGALAGIDNPEARKFAEQALLQDGAVRQNALGVQLGINQQVLLNEAGVDLANLSRTPDPGALRNTLMELMPSSTGYQFELMK